MARQARQMVRLDKKSARAINDALVGLGDVKFWDAANNEALTAAALPIKDAAQAGAPVRTGYLASDEGIRLLDTFDSKGWRKLARQGFPISRDLSVVVVAATAMTAQPNEYGTGPRYTKSGRFTGVMPAHPFMRPAWESNKKKALDIYMREIWPAIARQAKAKGA